MKRKCFRCGEDMILDCNLKIYEGAGSLFNHKQDYYVYKDGMSWGEELPVSIAVCPECGYLEPYVKSPKNLLK